MNNHFRRWLVLLVLAVAFGRPLRAEPPAAPQDRILILISLDAFRWDYLQKYKPPHLTRLATEGVQAERLIPMFPSLTFPNHHTIATGLTPEHHGVIHNSMYDPDLKERFTISNAGPTNGIWWGGEPIWVTAIKQGRLADCMFWPGVSAAIGGIRPTEWMHFAMKPNPNACMDQGLAWLDQPREKRPGVVVLYCHQPDSVGHHSGPDSPELATAITEVDDAIGRLVEGIHRLKLDDVVNIVVVSDHGMAEVSTNRLIVLTDFVDPEKVQVDFSGAVSGLRPLDGNVDALYGKFAGKENHFRVYRRENTPPQYHYRDHKRIPDVIVVADEGWYISRRPMSENAARNFEKATHGFAPDLLSMGATFIAWGPAFRRGVTIPPVENVHIYNLLCATLGLKPAPNDGDNRLVDAVLAK